LLLRPDDDGVDSMLGRALDVVTNLPGAIETFKRDATLFAKFVGITHELNQYVVLGILPFCTVVLALYENLVSMRDGQPYRVSHVLLRPTCAVVAILAYPTVCKVITQVAGYGARWMTTDDYGALADFDKSKEALGQAWDNTDGIGAFVVV